ncbi:formylglycine-generating enzyme family protein [Salinicola salarius]|uniref:formylglycine-generating enzyme family protein n=1 Tax=Salinicola salarius TaxID=430457 RepID=UPI000DA1661E
MGGHGNCRSSLRLGKWGNALNKRCCVPGSSSSSLSASDSQLADSDSYSWPIGSHDIAEAFIPAGRFMMGCHDYHIAHDDAELPTHEVALNAYRIDTTTVTNADFTAFVDATGYRTDAERLGDSAVFYLAVAANRRDILGQPEQTPWWIRVAGADWRHPGGRHSSLAGLENHPVVHVSWHDAMAYCHWSQRRLPTEAEWEFAARGGLEGARYPWGDTPPDDGANWRCNIWQGRFPEQNSAEDGWLTTAPVKAFAPNGWGLWQMVGNVWEWCSDPFDADYYANSPELDPRGPDASECRSLRGGSWMCHDSYCNRYRNSARIGSPPDSTSQNVGFRTVAR